MKVTDNPEQMRLTLLHEMCHALVEGERHAERQAMINAAPNTFYEIIREARAAKKADLTKGHDERWQREMWRLALDHEEYGLVPDLACYNQPVWDDLLARWQRLPKLLGPQVSHEQAMRCVAAYFREDLRAVYL